MQDENQTGPGAVIQPGSTPGDAPTQPENPPEPQQSPQPNVDPPAPATPEPIKPTKTPSAANWKYADEGTATTDTASASPITPVQWTASEFIEHSKNLTWYLLLAVGTVVFAAGLYLLTKDKVAAGVVVIVALTFGILANHKPRELAYAVDETGVHIGEKTYPYASFKSFAIVQENAIESIWLMPLKRFMPILTIYFDPNDEEKITDVLGAFLPLENHELDPVDKLLHKIRF